MTDDTENAGPGAGGAGFRDRNVYAVPVRAASALTAFRPWSQALSPLHRDVLYLLARGRTVAQIVEALGVAAAEVEEVIATLQAHFGVSDRRRLIVHVILTHRR